MKLSSTQWVGLCFFVASLMPAYLVADWQYEKKLTTINAALEREQSIHESTDKLVRNCEHLNQEIGTAYGPNYTICKQGRDIHDHTALAQDGLTAEKDHLKFSLWMIFLAMTTGINVIGYTLYKGAQYLNSDQT